MPRTYPIRFDSTPGQASGQLDNGVVLYAATPDYISPQRGPGKGKNHSLKPFSVHFKGICAKHRMASIFPVWHWLWYWLRGKPQSHKEFPDITDGKNTDLYDFGG